MNFIISALVAAVSLIPARPDLHGRVTDAEGRPLPGATAHIYTGAVRTGTSPYCPSCYADCAKSAKTDADGNFSIPSLDPELKFTVLVVAEGYKPILTGLVDPALGKPVEVKLAEMPAHLDPARILKGRIIGPDGNPVMGAIVSPFGCKTRSSRWWGSMPGVDAMSITNTRGEFLLTGESPAIAYDIQVEARGLATRRFALVPLGDQSHELHLTEGATVTGRLMKNGKPLSGITIGLVQDDRSYEGFTGAQKIATDAQGRFTFLNVSPPGEWDVYGLMKSMPEKQAVKYQKVQFDGDTTITDVGDLPWSPAFTVGGQIILSDGKPVPPGTRLIVGRDRAWDSQTVTLDPAGRFSVSGVPGEEIHVTVSIRGYHLSAQNISLDRLNLTFLDGTIEKDTPNLRILLEPGPIIANDPRQMQQIIQTSRSQRFKPLQGVAVQE